MTMPAGFSPEATLRYYRGLLEQREADQAVRVARWEGMLASATARQRPNIARQFNIWKARSDHEIASLQLIVSQVEEQITKLAEAARAQPTIEQETPPQDAPESSTEQPERFGKRRSWGNRKPPLAPGQKRRTG